MAHYRALLILLVACSLHAPASARLSRLIRDRWLAQKAGSSCPPAGYDAVKDLDLEAYISAPWYVQQQEPLFYQPVEQLYCVRAQYEPINPANPLEGLIVRNYANEGAVNGPTVGTSGAGDRSGGSGPFNFGSARIVGKVPDASRPAKLQVGFDGPLGAIAGSGPYWIVAVADDYSWAIITGGAPEVEGQNGLCRTSDPSAGGFQVNGVGFWLFARKPVDPEATAVMLEKAKELGLDTSGLKVVAQEGCKYEGA